MYLVRIHLPRARLFPGGVTLAGKSAHARTLAHLFDAVYVSVGDLLRAHLDSSDADMDAAARADTRALMARGELVHDALAIAVVMRRLRAPDCVARGFVLDGFPRTDAQAAAVHAAADADAAGALDAAAEAVQTNALVSLDAPDALVYRRMHAAAAASAAPLGAMSAVLTRLRAFYTHWNPIVERYAHAHELVRLDATLDTDAVVHESVLALRRLFKRRAARLGVLSKAQALAS